MVARWLKNKSNLHALSTTTKGNSRKRLAGGGRKPLSEELENELLDWFLDRRSKCSRVSRMLRTKKASFIYNKKMDGNEVEFSLSKGWCDNFMKRNGLSIRRKTSVSQKDPEMMAAKLVSYVLRVRKLQIQYGYKMKDIYAMDETPVGTDMISSSTVEKV